MNGIAILAMAALAAADVSAPRSSGLLAVQSIVSNKSAFDWGPSKKGLRLGIAVARHYSAKSPITVSAALGNESDHARYIAQRSLQLTYTLTNRKGVVVPMRPGVVFGYAWSAGPDILTVASGDAIQSSLDLAKVYALVPGRYRLKVVLWVEETTVDESLRLPFATLAAAPVIIQIF